VETLQTADVVLVQSEDKSSASEGVIKDGYTATVVMNPAMKPNSKVFVSFLGDPKGGSWVGEKGEGTSPSTSRRPPSATWRSNTGSSASTIAGLRRKRPSRRPNPKRLPSTPELGRRKPDQAAARRKSAAKRGILETIRR